MCGFGNYDNPYGLMFSLSLYEGIFHSCCLWSMCWIQVWMSWRQRYILYIGIKSSIRREESHMIKILSIGFQEKNSRYGSKSASWLSHELRYDWQGFGACNQMKSSTCTSSWSWVLDLKRRIQDMALNRRHGCLMSWDMVDKGLEHAIKWGVRYVPQDIKLEHVKILCCPRLRVEFGFELVNTWSMKNVPHGLVVW